MKKEIIEGDFVEWCENKGMFSWWGGIVKKVTPKSVIIEPTNDYAKAEFGLIRRNKDSVRHN